MGCAGSKTDETSRPQNAAPANAAAAGGAKAGGGGGGAAAAPGGAAPQQQLDPRLPFANFRDAFSLKNYWKTVRRKETFSKTMLLR